MKHLLLQAISSHTLPTLRGIIISSNALEQALCTRSFISYISNTYEGKAAVMTGSEPSVGYNPRDGSRNGETREEADRGGDPCQGLSA